MIVFPQQSVTKTKDGPRWFSFVGPRRYFPAWGISCSLIVHEAVLIVLLLLSVFNHAREPFRPPQRAVIERPKRVRVVMYFPRLSPGSQASGGSAEAAGKPGGRAKGKSEQEKSGAGEKAKAVAKPGAKPPVPKKFDGFVYPGPQEIVSDPPKPTNSLQTLVQPDLVNPPELAQLAPLPNLVLMKNPTPAVEEPTFTAPPPVKVEEPTQAPPPPAQEEPAKVEVEPTQVPPPPPLPVPVERPSAKTESPQPTPAPKPIVPPAPPLVDPLAAVVPEPVLRLPPEPVAVPEFKSVAAPIAPPPKPKPAEERKQEPPRKQAEIPKPVSAQKPNPEDAATPPSKPASEPAPPGDDRNLLALSPMPAPIDGPVDIPSAQAQARFATSPQPSLVSPNPEPRPTTGDGPSVVDPPVAVKTETAAPAGGLASASDAGTESKAKAGGNSATQKVPKMVTIGFGGGAGDKKTSGSGSTSGTGGGEAGGEGGRAGTGGAGSGSTAGPPGTGGAGSGSTAGPAGNSPFKGITVMGPGTRTGAVRSPIVRVTPRRPLQTSYGVTVLSMDGSGGGLSSSVFAGRLIHTVYLDMRQSELDSAPSWTLEFALPRKAPAETMSGSPPAPSKQAIVLPFPTARQLPLLSRDLVLKYLRQMVVVYGVINVEGKLEKMSVLKSPDRLFDTPVVEALNQWVFKPAVVDGSAVSVEVLLGIPIWLSK